MNTEYKCIKFDKEVKEKLDVMMVINLFKILYRQDKITKKEYESLVINICRTFNIKR